MTAAEKIKTRASLNKFFLLAIFLFPTVLFADPLPEIPTPYGGLVISWNYERYAFLLIMAAGLGTEYILMRLLTRRFGIKPLLWFLAFIGVHIVTWPLATHSIMALGDSALLERLADSFGIWFVLPFAVIFEVLVGVVEGIAFGMIFSKFGTLRKWIVASIIANIIGFIAGFVATLVIERWFYQLNH